MAKTQLELLVLYQDFNLMLQEADEEEKNMGFSVKGREKLIKAKDELEKQKNDCLTLIQEHEIKKQECVDGAKLKYQVTFPLQKVRRKHPNKISFAR